MASQPPGYGFKGLFHRQMEPVHPLHKERTQQKASSELTGAESHPKYDSRKPEYVQGSQITMSDPDSEFMPSASSAEEPPEEDQSDSDDEFLYGRQSLCTDRSLSPSLLPAGLLTQRPVGRELSSPSAITVRKRSTANSGEPIHSVLHDFSKPPSKPPSSPLPSLPRMPSLAVMSMNPIDRADYVSWRPDRAEKSLLPTPLKIPKKTVIIGAGASASADDERLWFKGNQQESANDAKNAMVKEERQAIFSALGQTPNIEQGGEEDKCSRSLFGPTGMRHFISYDQGLSSQFSPWWTEPDRRIRTAQLSSRSTSESITSHKHHTSVSSSSSSTDKPLPAVPQVALGPASEMPQTRNSGSNGKRTMHSASPNQEQFRRVKDSLRSPRRSFSPIPEGNQLDSLARRPPTPAEGEDDFGFQGHPLLRQATLASKREAEAKEQADYESEALIHPLFRQASLAAMREDEAKDLKQRPSRLPPSGPRRTLSDRSASETISPSMPHSEPPSTYLSSPPSSPTPPQDESELDTLSELPPFRSTRSSPQELLANYRRTSVEARASLEMSGPESLFIRRNFRPELRRSREALKEYAEAIEAIHGLKRIGDIDDEIPGALVLGKHELYNCGDIPNPSVSKVNLSPVAAKFWPMKKKTSLLKRLNTVDSEPGARGTRESSSTMSSASLMHQTSNSFSGSSDRTTDTGSKEVLPDYSPASSMSPNTPSRKRFIDLFGTMASKKEHELVMKAPSEEGHELRAMQSSKQGDVAVFKDLEEGKPKATRGHGFLKK